MSYKTITKEYQAENIKNLTERRDSVDEIREIGFPQTVDEYESGLCDRQMAGEMSDDEIDSRYDEIVKEWKEYDVEAYERDDE